MAYSKKVMVIGLFYSFILVSFCTASFFDKVKDANKAAVSKIEKPTSVPVVPVASVSKSISPTVALKVPAVPPSVVAQAPVASSSVAAQVPVAPPSVAAQAPAVVASATAATKELKLPAIVPSKLENGLDPWDAFTTKLDKQTVAVKDRALTLKEKAEQMLREKLAKTQKAIDAKLKQLETTVNAKLEPLRKLLKEEEKKIITTVNDTITKQLNAHIGDMRNMICNLIDGKIDEKVPSAASVVKGPAKDGAHWVVDTALKPFIDAVCTIMNKHRDSAIIGIANRIDERLCFKVRSVDDFIKMIKPIIS